MVEENFLCNHRFNACHGRQMISCLQFPKGKCGLGLLRIFCSVAVCSIELFRGEWYYAVINIILYSTFRILKDSRCIIFLDNLRD